MNREIKFRYLDTTKNKIYTTLEELYKDNEWTDEQTFEWFVCELFTIGFSNIEKLEYTGLLDKQGKEIYEGDIITYGFKTPSFNDLELFTGKIFFEEYMFLVDGDTKNNEWHSINRIHYTEVIGNIYESNLLSDK